MKRSRPTLSLLRIALKASRQATSAASSRLDCEALPKFPDALTSTTSTTVSSRSSVNFFTKAVPKPRRHVPIDRADLIARLILAHVLEVHPASLEDAVVIAREDRLHEALGLDLERADFLQDLRAAFGVIWWIRHSQHHGTGKPAKIRSTMVSLVIVSASAS